MIEKIFENPEVVEHSDFRIVGRYSDSLEGSSEARPRRDTLLLLFFPIPDPAEPADPLRVRGGRLQL